MISRVIACAIAVAGCDLGIGSDPNALQRTPCTPGHVRATDDSGCSLRTVNVIVDGKVGDWAGIDALPLAATCLAPPCDGLVPLELQLASRGPGFFQSSLVIRASFGGPPPSATDVRGVMILDASARHVDRLIAYGSSIAYEKNGYTVTSAAMTAGQPFGWVWTPDGFEAEILDGWTTFHGVARVAIAVERDTGSGWQPAVVTSPLTVCWSWQDDLESRACEVPFR